MNPKNVNDLDPKLKEAYDRVMGTNFNPQATAATQPQPQQSQNQPVMQTQPAEEQQPAIQSIPVQPPQPANPTPSPLPTQNPFVQTPQPPPTIYTQTDGNMQSMQKPKGHSFMAIVFLLGGTIFFAAYAIIWAKVFGLF
ncbi:MAG: hypothetical protein A3B38_00630 [Candidatus Levybacteria bacterium RIFCSPLOWO2_01_FULL_36_13]|nr:MAG: hypothetical protein A2684_01870 [Candidatus Levybacteria bacterium RIFCSPHIGHO2_01_FULL_36_15b]OGH35393.1 MAG: hypothetical protein A3B38_00630 [Candidatus Levybacteria bacterium RIFCSPLOWO2_01_FULL_36_13]